MRQLTILLLCLLLVGCASYLPTYSEILQTYPKGVKLCSSYLIMKTDENGKALFTGRIGLKEGEWDFCYGMKITVESEAPIKTGANIFMPGDKFTVDKDLKLIKIKSWE